MSYYGRGDYYSGMRGDYYRGDPFLGGILTSAVSKLAPVLGTAISKAGQAIGIIKKAAPALPTVMGKLPSIGTIAGTAATAVALGSAARGIFGRDGERKRRRMNVTNVKALRRALRRAEGFEKIAKRTVNALHRGPAKFKKQRRAS